MNHNDQDDCLMSSTLDETRILSVCKTNVTLIFACLEFRVDNNLRKEYEQLGDEDEVKD